MQLGRSGSAGRRFTFDAQSELRPAQPDLRLTSTDWTAHEISGTDKGIKFDLIQLLDLDADGDLDVITCEERDNLGVIWYQNPTK